MKKTLKAVLFLMVPVFTLSLFACKAETDTEYVEVEKIVEVEKSLIQLRRRKLLPVKMPQRLETPVSF